MTAKLKRGYFGHQTHGADHGTPHKRLMREHGRPNRAEGAMGGPTQGPPQQDLEHAQGAGLPDGTDPRGMAPENVQPAGMPPMGGAPDDSDSTMDDQT